jgi:hypothetical protein
MNHNNTITGSATSVGAYMLSITETNAYMQLGLGLLSGIASIYTIWNIYNQNKKKHEKS